MPELEEKLTTVHQEFNNLKSKRVTLAEMKWWQTNRVCQGLLG
jgi:hypothetical protein